jgi:hypothetical protein
MNKKKILLINALVLAVCTLAAPVLADQSTSQNAIFTAQNDLKNCYQTVRQAGAAGVNIDPLVATLNNASDLLSKAQIAYAIKDYDAAKNYATQCQGQLSDVVSQANEAGTNAFSIGGFLFEALSFCISVGLVCAGVAATIVLSKKQGDFKFT